MRNLVVLAYTRKEADMFNDMIMPIFQWWQLIADSSAIVV
jgi:hypothetical protein